MENLGPMLGDILKGEINELKGECILITMPTEQEKDKIEGKGE